MEIKERCISTGPRSNWVSPEIYLINLQTENPILNNSVGADSPGGFDEDDFFNNYFESTKSCWEG